jgi:CRP/FNR family cyclic AMP-dependent transcriptional regulator
MTTCRVGSLYLQALLGQQRSIQLRISHDELASMVATTTLRISLFVRRFKNLGLIEMSLENHLIIKETKLTSYLKSIA